MPTSPRPRVVRRAIPSGLAFSLAAAVLLGAAAPHHTSAVRPAPAAAAKPLTAAQASSQAVASGEAVVATALTTPTQQTTANADGSFTLTTSPQPVRVERGGTWVPLNASLSKNADGTYSPAATPAHLVLSGGGTGALAVMTLDGHQLAVTLPTDLPAPTVAGATATYASVLPDTDLVVTATDQGGYSDVFVVKTAAAAANPALSELMKATVSGTGLTVATDAAGNLTATAVGGTTPLFTAPAAVMWDSTTTPAAQSSAAAAAKARTATNPSPAPTPTASGTNTTDSGSGTPVDSSVTGPGTNARTATLAAAYSDGTLTLTPPPSMRTGADTAYPVFIDPSVGPGVASWTMVNSHFDTTSYWDTGTDGRMQVGYDNWDSPSFTARSFTTLNLSGVPAGATVSAASVNFWEDWAPSCTNTEVDLYQTGTISSATTWDDQPAWISKIGSATTAKGYPEGPCSSPGGIGFDIKTQVASALNGGAHSLTLGLRAADESDDLAWKQFNGDLSSETKTNASVTYDRPPAVPTLSTTPAVNCTTQPLGATSVNLHATANDPDGGNLTTTFDLYQTSDTGKTNLLTAAHNVPSDTYTGASGQLASLDLPESFFANIANGAPTSFTFSAQVSDGVATPVSSGTCAFTWDPTSPGAPSVTPDETPPTGAETCAVLGDTDTSDQSQLVGTPCAFTLAPPQGASISGYTYQLNQSPPVTLSATGTTTVTVAMAQMVNTLTVNAVSAAGNVGSPWTVTFDASGLPTPAHDGDITGDGTPDLVVPGNPGTAFPPGLWLAAGNADGTVAQDAVDIGTAGLGFTGTPADWNGAQVITGDFCGVGTQDALAYFPGQQNPSSNPDGGGGAVVCGQAGDGPLYIPVSGTQATFSSDSFADDNGNNATSIANGGTMNDPDAGELNLFYGVVPNSAGGQLDAFASIEPGQVDGAADLTGTAPPDAGTSWNAWTIATAQLASGTAMYLWDSATGELFLWTGVTLNEPSFASSTGIAYTKQYTIATGWNTGKSLQLRAADINGDGVPDLWATNAATGVSTAYIAPQQISNDPALSTATTDVTTADHAWDFQDIGTNTAGTALANTSDAAGALSLAGSAADAVWNTGDVYSPDALLNTESNTTTPVPAGTGTGRLNASGPAVTVGADFTVAAEVKPTALGGTVLSQDGTNTGGFTLNPDSGSGQWKFCMARTDAVNSAQDCATGGTVQLGAWTQLTASYHAATGIMTLYVNGVDTATATHTAVTGAFTGNFQVGAERTGTAYGDYYSGQVADLQTWNSVAPPAQPQTAGSDFVPLPAPVRIMDTRSGSGNVGGTTGPVAAASTTALKIDGNTTAALPSSGITAVALSVTAAQGSGSGFLTVYPDGTPLPVTSNVNYTTNANVTNGVITPVGTDGDIALYNGGQQAGTVQLIADITGYFTTTQPTNASLYTPLPDPTRILDTRSGLGAAKAAVAANGKIKLTVAGAGGIAATGVTAVAINLTATGSTAAGGLIAYPDSATTPNTSTVDFATGQTISAEAIVPVAANGQIDITNSSSGTTNIVGDVTGYFTTGSGTSGQKYHPLNATRLLDTRQLANGALTAGHPLQVSVQNTVSAVDPTMVVNVTTTLQSATGVLTAYPDGATIPTASTVDYAASTTIANLDLAQTPADATFDLSDTGGSTQVIIDTNGYFADY